MNTLNNWTLVDQEMRAILHFEMVPWETKAWELKN